MHVFVNTHVGVAQQGRTLRDTMVCLGAGARHESLCVTQCAFYMKAHGTEYLVTVNYVAHVRAFPDKCISQSDTG
jgi:hypothetical protein